MTKAKLKRRSRSCSIYCAVYGGHMLSRIFTNKLNIYKRINEILSLPLNQDVTSSLRNGSSSRSVAAHQGNNNLFDLDTHEMFIFVDLKTRNSCKRNLAIKTSQSS